MNRSVLASLGEKDIMPNPPPAGAPIEDVAAALGLDVRGRRFRCLNETAHKDKADERPSMTLSPESNRYKCFVCGARGDVIDLVRLVKKTDFRTAVLWLGGRPIHPASPSPGPVRHPRVVDDDAMDVLAYLRTVTYAMTPGSPGVKYLLARGICRETADRLGVTEILDATDTWAELTARFSDDRLRAAGLVGRSGRFLFARHRLLLWYIDGENPVYLQGRDTTGGAAPKELSLAGLSSPVPFNVAALNGPCDRVVVCEGAIDTLSAEEFGHRAVGVPGVTAFRDEWFDRFRHVGHVVLAFDNDAAGITQAVEVRAGFRRRGMPADAVRPAGVNDVNDLLRVVKGVKP